MDNEDQIKSYSVPWEFRPRLLAEHLGGRKYTKIAKAIGELVANGFDAGAKVVEIEFVKNKLDMLSTVVIKDDGSGITPEVLTKRFAVAGIEPAERDGSICFGQLGVGRFAVYRIGSLSRWSSVARKDDSCCTRVSFSLSTENSSPLAVTEESVPASTPKGTFIQITNLLETHGDGLAPTTVAADLRAQFCSYLLGNPDRKLIVNGETVDVQSLIVKQVSETIPATKEVPSPAKVNHLLLTQSPERSRFPAPLLFCAKGRTVSYADLDEPPAPNYLGMVECDYLDTLVTANREALIEMDSGFADLKSRAISSVAGFRERLRAGNKHKFIETARRQDFYPFREPPSDPITSVRKSVYDVVLETVNEHVNVEAMTKRQQAVVFRLLERSLDNNDLLDVLQHLLSLSDDEMQTFKRVLERTRLASIIKLTSEVTSRLMFLDVLHELVYGDVAKHVKERSQLHRILEPNSWLFGQQFHLASSDKSFRTVVRKHRSLAGLPDVDDEQLKQIDGIADIPDLFLAAEREYTLSPKHQRLLVEIKAPSVPLGRKEADQIRRYADTILKSHEFDNSSAHWDLFLVSAKASDDIERDRRQKGKPHGCLIEWEEMTLWAFEWSELISRAKEEMHLVRQHLQQESQAMSLSEYLRQEFPEILGQLENKLDSKSDQPQGDL